MTFSKRCWSKRCNRFNLFLIETTLTRVYLSIILKKTAKNIAALERRCCMSKLKNPLLTVFAIYLSCFAFRFLEYFVLRTDQTFWGEAFLHKLVGIAILLFTMKLLSSNLGYLGFTKKGALRHLLMGLLLGLAVFVIAYGTEMLTIISQGNFQSLELYVSSYAVDRNVGAQTGAIFFLLCISGNIINVLMEEGVFRGLFQKVLQQKYTFLTSVFLASLLFGLWHVIGPIRNYYDGLSSLGGMTANIIMLVLTSALGGFKFALLTKLTGSLYMAMGDHFVNNTIVNILHVVSSTGADEFMFVRITIAQTLSFIIVLAFYFFQSKKGLHAK